MQKVRLVGNISQFGEVWHTDCQNLRDIFKLIDCQTPGFRKYLLDAAEAGIAYEIQKGKVFIDHPEEFLLDLGEEDIIITEVPAGAKSGPAKILAAIVIYVLAGPAGLALEGTALTVAYSTAASLAIQGITQLLAPGVEGDSQETNEGYLFEGANNNISQGMPIPVAYGELRVGGAPISVSYAPFDESHFTATPLNSGTIGGGVFGEDPTNFESLFQGRVVFAGGDIAINWVGGESPIGLGTSSDPYELLPGTILAFEWRATPGPMNVNSNENTVCYMDPQNTNNIWYEGTGRQEISYKESGVFSVLPGDGTELTSSITFEGYLTRSSDDPYGETTIYFKRIGEEAADPATNKDVTIYIEGPTSVTEGETTANYTISLVDSDGNSAECASSIVVGITYVDSTATNGVDFNAVTTATIGTGDSFTTFTVSTIDDSNQENSETIVPRLTSPTGNGGFNSLTVDTNRDRVTTVILDNDGTTEPDEDGEELPEELIQFDHNITLAHTPGGGGTITTTADSNLSGSGTVAAPYLLDAGEVIKFQTTDADKQFIISTTSGTVWSSNVDQQVDEDTPAFFAVAEGSEETGTIAIRKDNTSLTRYFKRQGSGQVSITRQVKLKLVGPSTVLEGDETDSYTLQLVDQDGNVAVAESDIVINIAYSGTATRGTDYTTASSPATRTIVAGTSQLTYKITTSDDSSVESDETLIQTITTSDTGGFASFEIDSNKNSVTTTIIDDDVAVTISVDDGTVTNTQNAGAASSVSAGIIFNKDGSISTLGSGYSDTAWSSSTNPDVNKNYKIRWDLHSDTTEADAAEYLIPGTNFSGNPDKFVSLENPFGLYVRDTSADTDGETVAEVKVIFSIRKDGASTNADTATITLKANNSYVNESNEDPEDTDNEQPADPPNRDLPDEDPAPSPDTGT